MKRVLLLVFVLAAFLSIGLVVGCSSDDDGDDGGNPVITGDPNNPSYVFFADMVSESGDQSAQFALGSIFAFIDSLQQVPGKSPAESNADIVVYDHVYRNTWHVANFTTTIIDTFDAVVIETLTISGQDSLQIWVGGSVVETADQQPDSLKIGVRADVAMQNSEGSYASAQVHQEFSMRKLDLPASGDDWGIYGAGFDTLTVYFQDDSSYNCNVQAAVSTVYNGLAVNEHMIENDDCPTAGQMNNTMSVELTVGSVNSPLHSLNVDGTWTVNESFNNGTYTLTISFGNTVWSESGQCD